jgi:hypothetical protein
MLKTTAALILLLLAFASVTIVNAPIQPQIATGTAPQLTMTNTTVGNVLGGKVFALSCPNCPKPAQGTTCYFPIIVNASITWTGNTTYKVLLSAFHLTVFVAPNFISNATNFLQTTPNNRITALFMAPQATLTFEISFSPVCILPGTLSVSLIFNDGVFNSTLV